ncbi:MAG: hypothetical protein R3C28_19460 [Pirellulaceae bacterium]
MSQRRRSGCKGVRNPRSSVSGVSYDDATHTVTVTLENPVEDTYSLVVHTANSGLTDRAGNRIHQSRQTPLGEAFQIPSLV